MPLIAPAMQLKLQAELIAELTKAFAGAAGATTPASHMKMAQAIATAVSKVVVAELTTNAVVAPGIPSTPAATVGPGKIT